MSEAIRWWVILEVAAAILLPLCLAFFRRLPDRGFSLSKPFALLFLGYTFWMLNSVHILPNSNRGVVTALALLAVISGWFAYRERDDLRVWLREHWQYMVGVEVVFLLVFAVAAWARSLVGFANITEQPMDLMFVNAATHADHFPPKDPWLSGHTVAYYYFGYLIVAMTGRLAGVPTDVAYNLGVAMTAAFAFVAAGGIVYNLVAMRESAMQGLRPAPRPAPRQRAAVKTNGRAATVTARSLYTVLGVSHRASDAQIEKAYHSLAEKTSTAVRAGEAGASARLREINDAYHTLSTPESRRAYEQSLRTANGAPQSPVPPPPAAAPPRAIADTPLLVKERSGDSAVAGVATAPSGYNWRPVAFGLVGACLLVVMGNLEYLLEFASAYGVGGKSFYDWIDILGLKSGLPKHAWYPSDFFGFFRASRIYPINHQGYQAITEFPMFSYVLGDLHPHVMALPFVLLVVAAALALYGSEEPLDITYWLQRPLALIATAILLGGVAFINTWDVVAMSAFVVAMAFLSNFRRVRAFTLDLFVQVVSFALPLLMLSALLFLPFLLSIWGNSQANGISAVVSNDGVNVPGTGPLHFMLFWGPLVVLTAPFVGARLLSARARISAGVTAICFAPAALVLTAWMFIFAVQKFEVRFLGKLFPPENLQQGSSGLFGQIHDRGAGWVTAAALSLLLTAALLALWLELTSDDEQADRRTASFTLGLISLSLLLILGTEFLFVGDVFRNRMNTVFKLYYEAWMMLAVAGGFSLYYLASRWRFTIPREVPYRAIWAAGAVAMLAAGALYPLGATFNRAHSFDGDFHATAFLSKDEQQAINWLQDRTQGQDLVIAEAVGNDYTTAARISAATGAPAILGWKGHEDQWRGGACKACAGRFEDVNSLYTTTDTAEMQQILQKYGVTYVYVGDLERSTYGTAGMDKFKSLPVVFQCGAVTIYRAKGGGPSTSANCG